MKLEDRKLTVTDRSGKQIVCDVLLAFENEETGKEYIVYTDNTLTSTGKVQVYASVYTEDEYTHKILLQEIETEKEWETVGDVLETVREEIKMYSSNTDFTT